MATFFAKSVKWIVTEEDDGTIGSTIILPAAATFYHYKCLAVAVEMDQLILNQVEGINTLTPILKGEELSAVFSSLPEITKEEFYKIPAALTIYTYYKDVQAHQDEMKTAFDTLWTIWERDGVEDQDLAITLPNADIASIVSNTEGSLYYWESFTMFGSIYNYSDNSVKVTQIEIDRQWYGPTLRKKENLTTGEVFYEYEFLA